MAGHVTPRIFGIPAADADVVAVLRRGPSDWMSLGRWDVRAGAPSYEHGTWLRGTLYPQRCDLSPDGLWFLGFVVRAPRPDDWAPGATYVALTRLPTLRVEAAWGTDTWSRGLRFSSADDARSTRVPDYGAVPSIGSGIADATGSYSFAVERSRGWIDSADTPPRAADDLWDERRAGITVEHRQPQGSAILSLTGRFAAFRAGQPGDASYALDGDPIPDLQWADWTRDGRLAVATTSGRLELRTADDPHVPVWACDLAGDRPAH